MEEREGDDTDVFDGVLGAGARMGDEGGDLLSGERGGNGPRKRVNGFGETGRGLIFFGDEITGAGIDFLDVSVFTRCGAFDGVELASILGVFVGDFTGEVLLFLDGEASGVVAIDGVGFVTGFLGLGVGSFRFLDGLDDPGAPRVPPVLSLALKTG
jgi:hypothetical protein